MPEIRILSENTVMIPKPGKDPTKLDSYRPISLINVPRKVFELILKLRITEHFGINDILPPFQHGFRPEHSTQNALIGLTTDVEKNLNSGHCTVAYKKPSKPSMKSGTPVLSKNYLK
ncbi:hypothetical protein JTB14_034845 [Gonioctena quinquepunctata]|nr:hypothetical protein JTB14_034845 [Gonioctena quinquepunctata]